MEMLLSTDALIVAFEPDPRNGAQVTTTLMAMEPQYRNRVSFIPIALGVAQAEAQIFTASDNRGNAVVNAMTKDQPNQVMLAPVAIQVEALDDIFGSSRDDSSRIALIKMDVQGFECNVMDGGKRTFESAKALKTELDDHFLTGNDCSSDSLRDRIKRSGFDSLHEHGADIIAKRTSIAGAKVLTIEKI